MSGACRTPFRKPWHLTSAHRPNTLLIFSVTLKSFQSTTEISNQHMITIKTHLGNSLSAMICGVVKLIVVFQPNLWTLWEMEFDVHCVLSLLFLIPRGCLSSRYPLAPRWLRWAVTRVCGHTPLPCGPCGKNWCLDAPMGKGDQLQLPAVCLGCESATAKFPFCKERENKQAVEWERVWWSIVVDFWRGMMVIPWSKCTSS